MKRRSAPIENKLICKSDLIKSILYLYATLKARVSNGKKKKEKDDQGADDVEKVVGT